ncbi:MAG: phenylacetate--CoA ligase, partial [Planctomycetes bacterium]|nr:phenylacetate--CoA ligase [Planctomycetota bacterium]
MEPRFWNRQVETLERSALEAIQLERLRQRVANALRTPLYQKRLFRAGITLPEDIRTLEDLKRIPFTTKDDLRQSYPKGLLAVDLKQVVRVHSSSGTTGVPTVIFYTQGDLDRWTELLARGIVASGATAGDVFQNMMNYGLFTGGLGLHYGAERVGMTV